METLSWMLIGIDGYEQVVTNGPGKRIIKETSNQRIYENVKFMYYFRFFF